MPFAVSMLPLILKSTIAKHLRKQYQNYHLLRHLRWWLRPSLWIEKVYLLYVSCVPILQSLKTIFIFRLWNFVKAHMSIFGKVLEHLLSSYGAHSVNSSLRWSHMHTPKPQQLRMVLPSLEFSWSLPRQNLSKGPTGCLLWIV